MPDRRMLIEQIRADKARLEMADRLYQEKTAKHVALQLETVTGHEGWDVYVAHLKSLQETWEGYERGHIAALHGAKFLTPEEYGKARIDQAFDRGKALAFAEAIQTIKDLIGRGTPPQEEPHAT